MRRSIVLTIYRKEILETLRDWRTLTMMVGLPLLLYPILMIVVGKLGDTRAEALEARSSAVALWGETTPDLLGAFDEGQRVELRPWAGAPAAVREDLMAGRAWPLPALTARVARPGQPASGPSEREAENPILGAARQVVASKEVDAVVVVWPGAGPALAGGGVGRLSIYYDSVRDESRKARERVERALAALRVRLVAERERRHGLTPGFGLALDLAARNVASQARVVGSLIGALLPLLLITISASGGFYAAIDLTAGEKERNTMQTLLCAPVRSTEIIAGKLLAVWTVVLLAGLANVVSMAATFARITVPGGGLTLPLHTYALAFVALLPVTLMASALFLAVAVFARDFKDGQNLLTPVMLVLMMPVGITMLPGVELDAWTAFVPFVNIALLIKALFVGEVPGQALFLTILASAAYAALALLLAARAFRREPVLLGGRETVGGFLGLAERRGQVATPTLALVTYAGVLVLAFYGSLLLEGRGTLIQILGMQLGLILAPTLLVTVWRGLPWRATFRLYATSWQGLVAAVLVAGSAWAVAAGSLVRLAPPPPEFVKEMLETLLLGGQASLPVLLLLTAVLPAFCEELLFRGLILSGLRPLGPRVAIGVSALLFGLLHASLYRLLPTFFLGLLLGWLVWRSGSLLTSALAHALNNGIVVVMAWYGARTGVLHVEDAQALPWAWTLVAAAVLAAGLMLLARAPRRGGEGASSG